MKKTIAVLGSTGSIGTQTLHIAENDPDITISAMSCGKNIELFSEQVKKFKPRVVSVSDEEDIPKLKELISEVYKPKICCGVEGLIEVATEETCDMVLTAVVGMIGIRPTIAAIEAGKDIALANKETLVCAGHIIMPLAKKKGVKILPVDSEHSAIFQSLLGREGNEINKILLTASGGPFRGKTYEELENVTVKDALKHPNWSMGKKITIDSATMVNKGLEVIEAKWLFDVSPARIQVLVHPESILHSAVEYEDGAVIGQMGTPDMSLPIRLAIYYPKRVWGDTKPLDLFEIGALHFERPDTDTFFGLTLAYDAIDAGGNVPTVLNAANEKAVSLFLNEKIPFLRISELIAEAMTEVTYIEDPTVDDILNTELETIRFIEEIEK